MGRASGDKFMSSHHYEQMTPVIRETIYSVKFYMENNIGKKVKKNDLCELASMDYSRLNYYFVKIIGEDMLEYLFKIRVAKARELIVMGKHYHKIYSLVGFASNDELIRSFEKFERMTPRDYAEIFN